MGKSRLVAELVGGARGAGRARPLPLLRRGDHVLAGGRGAQAARRAAVRPGRGGGDPLAARARADAGTSAEEIAWAFRKLLESSAAPLVVVFDDIQWAEQTLLDLLEHVGLLSAGAPILLLCLARPELRERARSGRSALQLEPLPAKRTSRRCFRVRRPGRGARADRARRGRQPALRRGDARGRGRARATSRRAADPEGAARRAPRPARPPERAVLERGRGRGRGLPPRRRAGARAADEPR